MIQTPAFESVALIGENASVLATASSLFRRQRHYLPVSDGPRMGRPDWTNEVVRRSNFVAQANSRKIIFAGLSQDATNALLEHIPERLVAQVDTVEEAKAALRAHANIRQNSFMWSDRNLGVGLMLARQAGAMLDVNPDFQGDNVAFVAGGRHVLIACESGNEISQVIASNLAHSLGGSFIVFDPPQEAEAKELIESLYQIGSRDGAVSFADISMRVRELLPDEVKAELYTEIIFVSKELPYGIGVGERPTSHLRMYPDLGRIIAQSIWATQRPNRSARTALLIQPGQVDGTEIKVIADALTRNRTLTRILEGPDASVHQVDLLLQAMPWDLIVFSSHAGDAPGTRDTYVYRDDNNRERRLVVEQAVSIGINPQEELVPVRHAVHLKSLDGVDWTDKAALDQLPVGSAINAYLRLNVEQRDIARIHSVQIPRVQNAMAIQLHDHIWFADLHGLSPRSAPVVVVNACSSWHEMSSLFMYAGARSYIGTMFPITDAEAQEVAGQLLDHELGEPLSVALWRAQRSVYPDSSRRPYVLIGLPFCRLQYNRENSSQYLHRALNESIHELNARLDGALAEDVRRNFTRHRDKMRDELRVIENTYAPNGRRRR